MSSKAASLVTQAKQWAENYGDYTIGDEAAAYTAVLRVKGSWDTNDADGIAEVFIDNGSMLFGDDQLTSREEIRSYLAEAFAAHYKGSKLVEEPLEVRLVNPDVWIAITQGGIVLDGESEVDPLRENRTMWTIVKRNGEYFLASYQTSPIKG